MSKPNKIEATVENYGRMISQGKEEMRTGEK